MPFDGSFADRQGAGDFFHRKTIHVIQAANAACGHRQLAEVYVNISSRKLFKRVFLGDEPHFILDFHVIECLRFPVAEHRECGIADGGVHPAEKTAFGRVVLVDVREHFQHPIVDRRDDVVFVLKKVLAKRKQDRVKLPVQFFLTLALTTPATCQYLV